MNRTKLFTSVFIASILGIQTVTAQSSGKQAFPAQMGVQSQMSFIQKAPIRLAETSISRSFPLNQQHDQMPRKANSNRALTETTQPARVGFKIEGKYKQQLDSIITNIQSTGEGYTRTYFYYYDDTKLPQTAIAQVCINGEWQTQEQHDYSWDDDGYCLTQSVISPLYNYGEKHEYVYNDQKLGIEQIISQYTEGEWVPSQKGEYTYDERGNMIEELTYYYDTTTKSWIKYMVE